MSEDTIIEKAAEVKDGAAEHASDAVDAVKAAGSGILGKLGDVAGDIKEKAADAMHAVVDKAEEVTGKDLNHDGKIGSGE